MKKISVLAMVMMFGISGSALATAPDRVGKVDLGGYVAGAFNDNSIDDAAYVGLNMSYGVTPWIALGVEGGWQQGEHESEPGEVGIANIMGDVILRWHIEGQEFVPYGVLGLGAASGYASIEDRDDRDDSAFAWKLGGGVDWFVNSNWALNFEASWTDPGDLPSGSTANDDLDYVAVGGGIKYLFG
ncbi:MAG: hypothetical protein MOGMAGMI_01512 [Candidatus Omnitrophica bacterium]|nr:hypothetical protein [Candidatus Omnitrophota bacterium]